MAFFTEIRIPLERRAFQFRLAAFAHVVWRNDDRDILYPHRRREIDKPFCHATAATPPAIMAPTTTTPIAMFLIFMSIPPSNFLYYVLHFVISSPAYAFCGVGRRPAAGKSRWIWHLKANRRRGQNHGQLPFRFIQLCFRRGLRHNCDCGHTTSCRAAFRR